MLPGGILFASLLAAQATASRVPAPTPASPAEPPEPEIVTLAATPAPAPLPTAYVPRPIVAAPPAVAAAPPAPVPVAAAPKPSPAQAAAADTGRIPVLKTRDWAGKAPVYAIHFSSFQKRENSARDAATLSKRLKLPARPVEVELGAKGTWYRTMLGEFATAEDARRAASALPEDLARAAGFVYRVQAP